MKITHCLLLLALACANTGCRNRLVFATHTSIGLDVSGTAGYPNKVSLSYNRFEGAIVPRKTGAAGDEGNSVYGGMDADMRFGLPPKYDISQVFSTGEAAVLASKRDVNSTSAPVALRSPAKASKRTDPLVFFTGTTFGLHITLGEQEMSPNALLGYRRSEYAVIPIPVSSNEVRSVYADIRISNSKRESSDDNTNTPDATAGAKLGRLISHDGVHIKQSFATGRAAEVLARSNEEVRYKLGKAAGLVATPQEVEALARTGVALATTTEKQIDGLTTDDQVNKAIGALHNVGLVTSTNRILTTTLGEKKAFLKSAVQNPTSPSDLDKVKRFGSAIRGL